MSEHSAEKDAPFLCRLRLHRWGITTYPIGVRWCQRCHAKDHDASGYDPAMIARLTRVTGQPADKSEGLDDAGPVSCCSSPRRQTRVTSPEVTQP